MDSCKFIDVGSWQCFMLPIVVLFVLLGMGVFGSSIGGEYKSKWIIPIPSFAFLLGIPVVLWGYIGPIVECKGERWIEYIFRFWS